MVAKRKEIIITQLTSIESLDFSRVITVVSILVLIFRLPFYKMLVWEISLGGTKVEISKYFVIKIGCYALALGCSSCLI